jgi:beta-galactosidase
LRIEFDFIMEAEGSLPVEGTYAYIFNPDGSIAVDFHIDIDPGYKALPRVGVELALKEGFEKLEYYGRGPGENYSDRKLSASLGQYASTVTDQHFPFIPPSETGGHEDTRWLCLGAGDGRQLKISSKKPFHFDALHNSTGDYQQAAHDHELKKRGETFIHIDAVHGPIGSEMAWSTVMPKDHLLAGGSYDLHFLMEL